MQIMNFSHGKAIWMCNGHTRGHTDNPVVSKQHIIINGHESQIYKYANWSPHLRFSICHICIVIAFHKLNTTMLLLCLSKHLLQELDITQ